jgi:ferric-dicitrate binding protein FerR (iron transport regulator)
MKRPKKYWNEIASFLAGEMNDKESRIFLAKVEHDPQLKNDFQPMKKTWSELDSNPAEKYSNTEKAWELLHQRIKREAVSEIQIRNNRNHGWNYYIQLAAIALLILAVGIPTVFYSVNHYRETSEIVEFKSTEGTLPVDLPDGSQVYLNEGSSLSYKRDFNQQREVNLKGKGYFNVTADPEHPFFVNAGKVIVTVIGTSFNIKELENKSIEIFVESGEVRVDLPAKNQSLTLGPGELGHADKMLNSSTLSDLNYLSWKTRSFKFVDEPVVEILRVLEKAYHVEVNTEKVVNNELRLTTSYNDQPFDTILYTICKALDMNYEKEGKVYILQSN